MKEETFWSLLGSAAAVGAGIMARNAARKAYEKQFDEAPPENPAERDVGWRQALLWGACTGALVGAARVVGLRAEAEAEYRAKGGGRTRRALKRLKD